MDKAVKKKPSRLRGIAAFFLGFVLAGVTVWAAAWGYHWLTRPEAAPVVE